MTALKKTFFTIILISTINLFSQQIVTDRPDQTESSITLGKDNFQIETGILFQQSENKSIESFFGPSILLRYGISKGFELRLMTQHESTEIELDGGSNKITGLNDLQLGAKIQLLDKESTRTKMAFLSHVIIPTAKEELSVGEVGVINKLAISHVISDKIGVGYNVGFDYIDKNSYFTYALALGFSLSEKISLFIEPYGVLADSNKFENSFDTGLTYLVSDNFQLDISYGTGFNYDMNFFSLGFSKRFSHIFRRNNH